MNSCNSPTDRIIIVERNGKLPVHARGPMSVRAGYTLHEEVKQQQRGLYRFFEVRVGVNFLKFSAQEGPISFTHSRGVGSRVLTLLLQPLLKASVRLSLSGKGESEAPE
jgi:hypothetical protein